MTTASERRRWSGLVLVLLVPALFRQPAPAAGIDVARAPQAFEALMTARNTEAVTVSQAYILMKDWDLPAGDQQMSFVITAPVFQQTAGSGRTLRGWVLMGGGGNAGPNSFKTRPRSGPGVAPTTTGDATTGAMSTPVDGYTSDATSNAVD